MPSKCSDGCTVHTDTYTIQLWGLTTNIADGDDGGDGPVRRGRGEVAEEAVERAAEEDCSSPDARRSDGRRRCGACKSSLNCSSINAVSEDRQTTFRSSMIDEKLTTFHNEQKIIIIAFTEN